MPDDVVSQASFCSSLFAQPVKNVVGFDNTSAGGPYGPRSMSGAYRHGWHTRGSTVPGSVRPMVASSIGPFCESGKHLA